MWPGCMNTELIKALGTEQKEVLISTLQRPPGTEWCCNLSFKFQNIQNKQRVYSHMHSEKNDMDLRCPRQYWNTIILKQHCMSVS